MFHRLRKLLVRAWSLVKELSREREMVVVVTSCYENFFIAFERQLQKTKNHGRILMVCSHKMNFNGLLIKNRNDSTRSKIWAKINYKQNLSSPAGRI